MQTSLPGGASFATRSNKLLHLKSSGAAFSGSSDRPTGGRSLVMERLLAEVLPQRTSNRNSVEMELSNWQSSPSGCEAPYCGSLSARCLPLSFPSLIQAVSSWKRAHVCYTRQRKPGLAARSYGALSGEQMSGGGLDNSVACC